MSITNLEKKMGYTNVLMIIETYTMYTKKYFLTQTCIYWIQHLNGRWLKINEKYITI